MAQSADELWKEGLRAGRNRNYNKALKCFLQCEALGRPDAWLMIGRCYLSLNKLDEAILALLAHLARFPDDAVAYFHLGRAYLLAKRFSRSVQYFMRAKRLGLEHRQLEALWGWALLKSRKIDPARQILETAVLKNPDHPGIYQLYLNSILVWAIDAFRKESFQVAKDALIFLMQNGHQEFLVRLYLAASLREIGEFSSSYSLFLELHQDQPRDLTFLLNLWELAHRLGLVEETEIWETSIRNLAPNLVLPKLDEVFPIVAKTLYEKGKYSQTIFYALKSLKNKKDPYLYFLVGQSYYQLGNKTKAVNHLKQSLKINASQEVRLTLLKILCESQRWEEARHELRLLYESTPETPRHLYFKILIEAKLSKDGIDHVQTLKKAIKTYGSDSLLVSVLGEVLHRQKNFREARIWLGRALKLDPNEDQALNLYLSIQDPPPSLEILEHCYQGRRSHHADLNRTYAHCLLKIGKAEKSRSIILENLKHDADSDHDWEHLAEAERVLQNYTASYAIWIRQLRKSPENRKAILHLFYLLYKMNQAQRAESLKFQSINRLKDNNLHYSFAKAYEKLGLLQKAIDEYNEHLSIYPNHAKSREDLETLLKKATRS